ASPLTVTVSSPFGEPVVGGVVNFLALASGASATFAGGNTAAINATGQASMPVGANDTAGSYSVTAATGAGGTASFTLTNVAAITLSPTSLPDALAGVAYSQTLSATGGNAPYTFAVTAGALPAGFTLSADGALSGSTTVAGTSSFTITATDQ